MDRGAWWATVHGDAESWTWLKRLSMHMVTHRSEISHWPMSPSLWLLPSLFKYIHRVLLPSIQRLLIQFLEIIFFIFLP